MSGQDTLFPALVAGLAEFRARIEGSSGDHRTRILRVEGQDNLASTVIHAVLGALGDVLAWLYEATATIDRFITQADAILAMLAVVGQGIEGLGEALDSEWPEGFPDPGPVAGALTSLGGVLAEIGDIELPSIIPDPAALAAIRTEIRALLGTRVAPEAEPPTGSLQSLIEELQGSA